MEQDRDKGVVTLTGTVVSEVDKAQAESIAKSIAGMQVVDWSSSNWRGEQNQAGRRDARLRHQIRI